MKRKLLTVATLDLLIGLGIAAVLIAVALGAV